MFLLELYDANFSLNFFSPFVKKICMVQFFLLNLKTAFTLLEIFKF